MAQCGESLVCILSAARSESKARKLTGLFKERKFLDIAKYNVGGFGGDEGVV
jgi:hypothetical protein